MENYFSNCNIDELHIKTFNCICGKKHKANVDKIFFCKDGINKLATHLKENKGIQSILILIENNDYMDIYEKVNKILTDNFFFTKHLIFEDKKAIDISICDKLSKTFEQERIIIGIGGNKITNFIKYYANTFNKYSILIPTYIIESTMFSKTTYTLNKGKICYLKTKGIDCLVVDENIFNFSNTSTTALAFSELINVFMHIFNFNFSSILTGKSYCKEITKFILNTLFNTIKICEGLLRRSKRDLKSLIYNMIQLNIGISFLEELGYTEMLDNEILHILSLIDQYKNLDYRNLQKMKFHINLELCNIYKLYLSNKIVDVAIPPNLSERSIILSKITGKKIVNTLISSKRNTNLDKYFLLQYKCNEYKEEFLKKVNNIYNVLNFAYNQFKRLLLNYDYILKDSIPNDKFMLAINLVCDTTSSYTLLKHIVSTGILDKYVDKKIV